MAVSENKTLILLFEDLFLLASVELLEDPYTKSIPLPRISNHYVPGRDS
jgi:hypothetical protein